MNSDHPYQVFSGLASSLPTDLTRLHAVIKDRCDCELTIPSILELDLLLSTAFWASLEKEEGRPVVFTLVFGAGGELESSSTLRLGEALLLNVRNLVKLAPALLPGRRAMVIGRSVNNALQILATAALPTRTLSIQATEPGVLWIRMCDTNIAVFRSGSLTYLANDHSDNLLFLVNHVSEYGLDLTPEFALLCEALEKVIEAMVRQQHGGALIWVPQGANWITSVKSIKYLCSPPYRGLLDAIDNLYPEGPPQFQLTTDTYRRVPEYQEIALRLASAQETFEEIGQLTAVDGATVVRDDLVVLAFGVMLRSDAADGALSVRVMELGKHTHVGADGFNYDEMPLSALGGARHRSAAEFICDHHDSLAFVASQDGGLVIFGWQQKSARLFAIRHAELALS